MLVVGAGPVELVDEKQVVVYAKDFSFGEAVSEWKTDLLAKIPPYLVPHGAAGVHHLITSITFHNASKTKIETFCRYDGSTTTSSEGSHHHGLHWKCAHQNTFAH